MIIAVRVKLNQLSERFGESLSIPADFLANANDASIARKESGRKGSSLRFFSESVYENFIERPLGKQGMLKVLSSLAFTSEMFFPSSVSQSRMRHHPLQLPAYIFVYKYMISTKCTYSIIIYIWCSWRSFSFPSLLMRKKLLS